MRTYVARDCALLSLKQQLIEKVKHLCKTQGRIDFLHLHGNLKELRKF
jgi:hypothetical protein